MKEGIRTYLLADSSISAALATTSSVYSFPVAMGAASPYIVLSRVTGEIQNTLNAALGTYVENWQVDVFAATDAEAEALKELVIARLNTADRVAFGDYHVYSCSLTTVTETTELESEGGETAVIRKTLEFEILRNIAENEE
jgi:hypothetical protein